MIDEGVLADLLTEHALRIEVPDSAIGDLLAASPPVDTPFRSRFASPSSRVLAAAAAVALIAAASVWGLAAHSNNRSSVALDTAGTPTNAQSGTLGGSGAGASSGGVAAYGVAPRLQSEAPAGASHAPQTSKPSAAPTDNAHIVRTGTLDLRVKRHEFGETISRITTIAAGAGGFISDEKTYESAAVPSGTVTIRVPSAHFNATVDKLRALGTIVSASTQGVDVTGKYVDLGARLAAATASRDQYLTVLAHATNIGDILAVQDRIQGVQTQIEELQGELNLLDNQTTYGTITASVSEPAPKPNPPARPHHEAGIAVAWGKAQHGFTQRVEGIVSHAGSALVVIVGLLLLGSALRLVVPRMRRLLV